MKNCDSCIRPEVCETSGWCHRAEEKADDRLALTTCSRLRCEECNVELPASREEDPHMTAAKAKNAGVWVKNFIIYGDESGYHYFCCADHGKVWREKNIPSANARHLAAAEDGPNPT